MTRKNSLSCSPRWTAARCVAGGCGLLGERHEPVLERRLDFAYPRLRKSSALEAIDEVLVGDASRDDGVHGLAEDRGASDVVLRLEEDQGARRPPVRLDLDAAESRLVHRRQVSQGVRRAA